jgi:hypothetical protein
LVPDSPCRAAGLLIEAPKLTATPGSSGSFDLLLVNTNPAGGASYNVAADSFGLALSGPLNVTFTNVTINTSATYIYVTSGTTVPGGMPLSLDSFPNTQFTGSDFETASPLYRTVTPGESFGLAHVSFAVSSTTPNGTERISLVSSATSLSDNNGKTIGVSLAGGSLRVGAVPEPATLTQAAIAALIGLGWFWSRRKSRGAVAR